MKEEQKLFTSKSSNDNNNTDRPTAQVFLIKYFLCARPITYF